MILNLFILWGLRISNLLLGHLHFEFIESSPPTTDRPRSQRLESPPGDTVLWGLLLRGDRPRPQGLLPHFSSRGDRSLFDWPKSTTKPFVGSNDSTTHTNPLRLSVSSVSPPFVLLLSGKKIEVGTLKGDHRDYHLGSFLFDFSFFSFNRLGVEDVVCLTSVCTTVTFMYTNESS